MSEIVPLFGSWSSVYDPATSPPWKIYHLVGKQFVVHDSARLGLPKGLRGYVDALYTASGKVWVDLYGFSVCGVYRNRVDLVTFLRASYRVLKRGKSQGGA